MSSEAIAYRFTLKTAAGCRVALPQQLGQNFKTLGAARAIANGKPPHLIPVGLLYEVDDGQSLKTVADLDVLVEVFVLAKLFLAVFGVIPVLRSTPLEFKAALATKFPKGDAARTAAKNAAEKSAPTYLGTNV